MSPRKQIQIPGTERTQHPEIETAAQAYASVRDERSELSKREHQKKIELLVTMKSHKVTVYKFYDGNGEEVVARVDEGEPKVTVRKTGEAESEVGHGVSTGEDTEPAGMGGLIAQAMKAQDDAGVSESSDGDVEVPDTAAPKQKRGRKAKAS